jgi:hypothetical protein
LQSIEGLLEDIGHRVVIGSLSYPT